MIKLGFFVTKNYLFSEVLWMSLENIEFVSIDIFDTGFILALIYPVRFLRIFNALKFKFWPGLLKFSSRKHDLLHYSYRSILVQLNNVWCRFMQCQCIWADRLKKLMLTVFIINCFNLINSHLKSGNNYT